MAHLRSMTGFGAGEAIVGGRRVTVEIKTVNGRFLDTRLKLPPGWFALEPPIIACLQSGLSRGRVEVHVRTQEVVDPSQAGGSLGLDVAALKMLVSELTHMADQLGISSQLDLQFLLNFKDEFRFETGADRVGDGVWKELEPALKAALDRCVASRETEGAGLKAELDAHLGKSREIVARIGQIAKGIPQSVAERLKTRLGAILASTEAGAEVDPGRLAQEVAILAERADVDEEIGRLDIHVNTLVNVLNGDASCIGRRIDFLLQEMNREANTIGSKSPDVQVSQAVVDLKVLLERMREQAQNIE